MGTGFMGPRARLPAEPARRREWPHDLASRQEAGRRSLGDIGDIYRRARGRRRPAITGQAVEQVSVYLRIFVAECPLLDGTIGVSRTALSERGRGTVDDAAGVRGAAFGRRVREHAIGASAAAFDDVFGVNKENTHD